LLDLLDPAGFCDRVSSGFRWRHARRDLLVGEHVGVGADFGIEAVFDLAFMEKIPKRGANSGKDGHFVSP